MNAQSIANITASVASLSEGFATRKVTADDVWNGNRDQIVDMAHDILESYTGTFPFMVNMIDWVKAGCTLTDSQIAGILNAAINDYRYQQRKAAVTIAQEIITEAAPAQRVYDHSKQYVADGWYSVQGNTSHRTIRLQTVKGDKGNGVTQWLAYLNGPDNMGDYLTIGFVKGNEVTLFRKNEGKYQDIVAAAKYVIRNVSRLGEFGKNYAVRSTKCYRCNKPLTDPESVMAGLGPVCRTK